MADNQFVQYINHRIKRNKNFLAVVTGPTGSGKSWTAISMAEQIDSDFTIKSLFFRAKDGLSLINSGKLPDKKGNVLIWDEAGIEIGSRTWQSMANRLINFLLQTFRHRCFILIFTAPYSDFIDSQTRKLFHCEFKTQGISYRNRTVKINPLLLQYNSSMKKTYVHHLIVPNDDGKIKIKRWHVKAPSKKLLEQYETKKNEFTSSLNKEIELALKGSGSMSNKLLPLTDKEKEVYKLSVQGLNGIQIAERKEISPAMVSKYLNKIRNKGYV